MNTQQQDSFKEFHWMIEMLQTIDVGVVVLNQQFEVDAWNGFMENHSGLDGKDVLGENIFSVFKSIDEPWFRHKADTVFQLKTHAFTIWEQRNYLFKFDNYRPITSTAPYMYQNSTFIPIKNHRGEIEQIAVLIYDVTDAALNKIDAQKSSEKLKYLSRTDRLTGLSNRGYWEECFSQ